jgi:glutamate 5-kinase
MKINRKISKNIRRKNMIQESAILPIKIGTESNVKDGRPDEKNIEKIAMYISGRKKAAEDNKEDPEQFYPLVIASGAGALDLRGMGYEEKPNDILLLKICTSEGQGILTEAYQRIFRKHGLRIGQFLFTYQDLDNPKIAEKLKQTFYGCFEKGVIPLINYNDPLNGEEILADNDRFAARIANLVGAWKLLILTKDVKGFKGCDCEVIPEVNIKDVNELEELKKFCFRKTSQNSTGGMETKLDAIKDFLEAGGLYHYCVLGNIECDIDDLLYGKCVRTIFRKIGHCLK